MSRLPRWTGLAGMVLIAAALVGHGYWSDATQRAFVAKIQADGHRITATVQSKRYQPNQYARPGGVHAVTVEYTDLTGRTFLAENVVSERFYEAAARGDVLPFWYLDDGDGADREWMLDPDHGLRDMVQIWALAVFLTGCGVYTYLTARRHDTPEAEAERAARRAKLAEIKAFKARMAAKSENKPPE